MSEMVHPIEENILEAARALIEDVGENFTMEQLESKAKVSRATIYRRVGNKDALLEHLAHQRGESFEKTNVRLSILNAARIVFSEEGLLAATMEQIAEQAEVGVATVYRHFGDKEGLVHAFIEEATPRPVVHALAMKPTKDVAADLEKIIGMAIPFFLENRDILRLVFMGGKKERSYLLEHAQAFRFKPQPVHELFQSSVRGRSVKKCC